MTYALKRRAVVPPRDPANRQSIEQLKFAVDELSGAVGMTYDRAVRVGELIEAGLLHIQVDGTLGINAEAKDLQGPMTLAGDLTFIGAARRIRGDFNSSPVSNRLMFQAAADNAVTNVGVIPNGTATTSVVTVFNSSDPNNAGALQLRMDSTWAAINSQKTGSGVLRDLSFQFDGLEVARLSTSGEFRTKSVVIDRGTNAADAVRDLFAQNGAHWLGVHARLLAGAYNPIVQAGDKALFFSEGAAGTGALVLAPWANSAAGLRITPTLSTSAPTVTVAGSLSSDGAYAALWFQDRSSSNRWAWYAGGGTAWLWNGSANVVGVTAHRLSAYNARIGAWASGSPYVGLFAGDMTEGAEYMVLAAAAGSTDVNTYVSCRSTGSVKVRPGGNNGSYETSFETVGAFFRTPLYQLNAASSAFVRQPRIFVQSADPGTAASDGDVWVWTGFVRYRSAGAWVTAAT